MEKLLREVRLNTRMGIKRCQRLNEDGKRCKRQAKVFVTMHQGEYTYDSEPKWCVVGVCKHHASGTNYEITDKDSPVDDKNKIGEPSA